jgi:hypothetical protein
MVAALILAIIGAYLTIVFTVVTLTIAFKG